MTSDHVWINDVSPRDGLQNERGVIATSDKARLVGLLAASGVDEVEVTSFVSKKWVPQLGDASELLALLGKILAGLVMPAKVPVLSALVPNAQGLEALLEARKHLPAISKVSVFTAASETFAMKNTNATIAQTLERFAPVVAQARQHGLVVRGYISCVVACPFEGPTKPDAVRRVADSLWELGVDEVDLGDTIGKGDATSIRALLELFREWPSQRRPDNPTLTMHLHDTFGMASECVRVALDMGVRSFDGAVAGLGGCPYASTPTSRAPGNIATSTLVDVVRAAGCLVHVDAGALDRAGEFASAIVREAREREQRASPGATP